MNATCGQLLVVDDSPSNRNLLSRFFASRGFEVAQAECGASALNMIKQQRFDAVLLDILMPEIDGIEVLKRIRESHTQVDLPVIVVSGQSASKDVRLALDLGANDYIIKPINFDDLWIKLRRTLGPREISR